jgi:hypothetical protein
LEKEIMFIIINNDNTVVEWDDTNNSNCAIAMMGVRIRGTNETLKAVYESLDVLYGGRANGNKAVSYSGTVKE